ncbi:hypothetical protein EDM56_30585 [Brevibacillus fluminis]|uniref:Uncharacterized protein n=1 Tax=Brevibacillus fluminis TaxID=511487 RepID=A0A3M8CUN4_9BACL|nr:hypothetical protein [Brevibacillus fluminis]RNB78545.1 hypothetical protein EDM56_30585 [Brevibacillus fluminis]
MFTKSEVNEKLLEWLAWRLTMKSLRQDAGVMETASHLKLGIGYGLVLRELSETATTREQAAYTAMQTGGITVLGVKEDRGETFVWWKQRGRPDMYRIADQLLQPAAQMKLGELIEKQ